MFRAWLAKLIHPHSAGLRRERRRSLAARGRRTRLGLEALEDRTLLSTYVVDRLTDTGDGDGLTGDLRYAITNAISGEDIITFAVTGTISLTGALPTLSTSVNIEGPGSDLLTVRRTSGGFYRIFTVAAGTTVMISGLTIANGGIGGTIIGAGGGIHNSGTLFLSNTTLRENFVVNGDERGGGIFNEGTLTITNCMLSGNLVASDAAPFGSGLGGGIFNQGTLTVSNSTLSGNGADTAGGGIFNSTPGTVTITSSNLSGNGTARGGAGIENTGTMLISSSTLSGNTAPFGGGGGIRNSGTLTISSSTLSGNRGSTVGAIDNQGTLTISSSTISGNVADAYFPEFPISGGIANSGTLTVRNSTFSGNSHVFGGCPNSGFGIFNSSQGTLIVSNSTLAGDALQGISNAPGGILHARNTIIAGLGGSLTSSGYNLIGNAFSGTGYAPTDLLDVDPLLGPLQDNGGPTWTHALLPGSPALDAGGNTDAPDFDQRGLNRVVGGTIDIGAFEVQPGAAIHLVISAPASAFSGVPFDVTVIALDAYGHVAVGYTGTVTFTSTDTDPGVMLPADYTFTADDQGVHTFAGEFLLVAIGEMTLTATDLADGITGSVVVVVG